MSACDHKSKLVLTESILEAMKEARESTMLFSCGICGAPWALDVFWLGTTDDNDKERT